uniref:ATP-dependent DNA helicase n=1 Tax=Elaeis guineensis var. tenera TaxID=51953 RepID=A0A6I9QKH2_ELAGV|nr:uncharacterized protein LOC105037195 [Elaeis guineensis]
MVVFSDDEPIDFVVKRNTHRVTMFNAWLEANKKYSEARNLTYADFPTRFVFKKDIHQWSSRKYGFSIGKLYYTPPESGEIYYLRTLLNIVKGPTCYEDIKIVDGVHYCSFKDACYAMGLLDDEKEYIDGIVELTITYITTLQLTDEELKNYALIEIENLLQHNGRSLIDFESMPYQDMNRAQKGSNKLMHDELSYNRSVLVEELQHLLNSLIDEQRYIYDKVISAVNSNDGGIFFVYGYGGTGKTFVWKTLSASLRSQGNIMLNVAFNGIASLLLSGGRTAHSRFGIPLQINEDSVCNIRQGSDLAELLVHTQLIIWDEAPMTNKFCFEALDRSLRDIMRFLNPECANQPFRGKIIVFDRACRQILPVIPKGTRLHSGQSSIVNQEIKEFSNRIISIGEGATDESNEGEAMVDIPDDVLINISDNPIKSIVENTYPNILENINDLNYFQGRAILAPTLLNGDIVNEYMLSMIPREERIYLSSDSVCWADANIDSMDNLYTAEYLNSIRMLGLPKHMLKLKVSAPMMLLRNIDKSLELCNGTRLIISQLEKHVLEAKVISESNIG